MLELVYIREFINKHIRFLSKKFHKNKKSRENFHGPFETKKGPWLESPWSFDILLIISYSIKFLWQTRQFEFATTSLPVRYLLFDCLFYSFS